MSPGRRTRTAPTATFCLRGPSEPTKSDLTPGGAMKRHALLLSALLAVATMTSAAACAVHLRGRGHRGGAVVVKTGKHDKIKKNKKHRKHRKIRDHHSASQGHDAVLR